MVYISHILDLLDIFDLYIYIEKQISLQNVLTT